MSRYTFSTHLHKPIVQTTFYGYLVKNVNRTSIIKLQCFYKQYNHSLVQQLSPFIFLQGMNCRYNSIEHALVSLDLGGGGEGREEKDIVLWYTTIKQYNTFCCEEYLQNIKGISSTPLYKCIQKLILSYKVCVLYLQNKRWQSSLLLKILKPQVEIQAGN